MNNRKDGKVGRNKIYQRKGDRIHAGTFMVICVVRSMDINMGLREIVLQYIDTKDGVVTEEDDLMTMGLDSLVFVKLIVSLEEEYSVQIEYEDLLIENFNTLGKIKQYLEEKCGVVC
ncbi:MAG: Phosphopantetheine attachment site [Herbinix sp.]|jgi:acyl carrier protein|nr:Phosphopantetheine attachment site [Herbinix sp.]